MKRYRLACSLDLRDLVVQALLWLLLVPLTAGMAAPFFVYYVVRLIIDPTDVHEVPA